nr:DEAD/DEAH box helicase [Rhodovulum kholense]
MGLPKRLVTRLAEAGITEPTPVQARAIPPALEGRDVIGLAQTGTGKTAAFGLPLLTALSETRGKPVPKTARALVLAPTRELVKQIAESLRPLVAGTPVSVETVVGGASLSAQEKRMARGADLLVATPGRLIDLMGRGAVVLAETRFLVLDEADQMLDLGFIHALRRIAAKLPKERQTMLFSATMPKQMDEIAASYLTDPVRVEVTPPGTAVDKILQSVHFLEKAEKTGRLIELLDGHRDDRAIVFGRTKHGAERLSKQLERAGFATASIHGNKSQGQRDRAIKAFRAGDVRVLVATDVAARGIDIPEVRHVYNFDLPNVPDNYVHRIGRTARAGADGAAIAFCSPEEVSELRAIQKVMGTAIPVASGTPWEGLEPKQSRGGPRGASKGAGKPPAKARARRRPRNKNRAAACPPWGAVATLTG